MLLMTAMAPAAAEWKNLATNDAIKVYYDPTSIRRTGHIAKIWTLADYSTPVKLDDFEYLSLKNRIEIDCQNELARSLSLILYAQKMGIGTLTRSSNEQLPWRPIAPETINSNLQEVLCQ